MLDFITKYWMEVGFGLICGTGSYFYTKLAKRMQKQESLNNALLGLLHNEIYKQAQIILAQGYCTIEQLDNLTGLYTPYHDGGGNGTGTRLYEKCCGLPLMEGKE